MPYLERFFRDYVQARFYTTPLYHVTTKRKATTIHQEGFRVASLYSEYGPIYEETDDMFETPRQVFTRESFNNYLNEARLKVGQHLPNHDFSIFFWANKARAGFTRRKMEEGAVSEYVIIIVNPTLIPCVCYQASSEIAEELFDLIDDNSDDFYRILNTGVDNIEDKALNNEAKNLAIEYYETMHPYDGSNDPDVEVLCSCDIPRTAIEGVIFNATQEGSPRYRPRAVWT